MTLILFGPPPTAFSEAHIACLAELLGQIDMAAVLASHPADETEAATAIGPVVGRIVGGPTKYLLSNFNALRKFYLDAAQRHLLVVLWWD